LAQPGDGLGKAPVRYAHSHAALNDFRKLDHLEILSQHRVRDTSFAHCSEEV
jgi:hypothetical protein